MTRRGLPIFVQLLALALMCLVAVQLVNLAAMVFMPEPPPEGFSVAEAARALKGEAIRTQAGRRLVARLQDKPPAFANSDAGDMLSPVITQTLAQALGVSSDKVRVAVEHQHSFHTIHVSSARDEMRSHVREHTQVVIRMSQTDAPMPSELMARHMDAVMTDAALFPPFAAAYQTPQGRWSVIEPPHPFFSAWHLRMLATYGASALIVTLLAWFMARRLARPIHAFAIGAERLGGNPQAPPLPSQGPAEVRTAVAAFNEMQEKLRRYVGDRTLMIAAIAHDLRTPLMRLRFRIESAPADIRDKTIADIEQMDGMISAALAYARGETANVERVRLDLTALASSVAADLNETGAHIAFEPGKPVVVLGDGIGLKRLLTNLLDNAVKFGGGARMRLAREGADAVIEIDDDGPGLPESELDRVFDPFYRPDAARSAAAGGFGLGLAAARSIARAHGGEVSLSNRPGGGMTARVVLPAAD
jgi:signal transduction histidine kinase